MGDLAAFPIQIAGAAVEVIKLPELIHQVKKARLEVGRSGEILVIFCEQLELLYQG